MKTKHTQTLRAIAKITSVFGIRGEVKIFSYARTAEEFEDIAGVLCGLDETHTVPCEIESVRTRGNEIYLKLVQCSDRTTAEHMTGKYLFVEESQRIQLPPEKFFVDDLMGCTVVDETGKKFGEVVSVDALPSQMIYTVKTKKGSVMLPAAREFILSVNVDKKEIVVHPPEGLFGGEML